MDSSLQVMHITCVQLSVLCTIVYQSIMKITN